MQPMHTQSNFYPRYYSYGPVTVLVCVSVISRSFSEQVEQVKLALAQPRVPWI